MSNLIKKESRKSHAHAPARAKERESTKRAKAAMLEALRATCGLVMPATKKAKVGSRTHYEWMKADPDYAAAVRDLRDEMLDFVESALMSTVKDGNVNAIIFYLKCHGRERGYVERSNHVIETTDRVAKSSLNDLSLDQLDAIDKIMGHPKSDE